MIWFVIIFFFIMFLVINIFFFLKVFLEVGVLSYFENVMFYMFEVGWNFVKLWVMEKWKGFFVGDVVGGKIY